MKREQLRERLVEEVERYATSLSYAAAVALRTPIVEQRGEGEHDSVSFYQVAVRLLEVITSEREDYAHVTVSVDDGRGWGVGPLRVVVSEVASIIFHRDGRVERAFRRGAAKA